MPRAKFQDNGTFGSTLVQPVYKDVRSRVRVGDGHSDGRKNIV